MTCMVMACGCPSVHHACGCQPAAACPKKPAPEPKGDIPWRVLIVSVAVIAGILAASFEREEWRSWKWVHRDWLGGLAEPRPPPAPTEARPSGGHAKIGGPYQVNGVWYVPAREDDYDEVGFASWYGAGLNGRRTANGETFDESRISAAHTTLPLPSIVEVTNLENDRTIEVRLNDRGPFVDDRIIGLSRAAARALGFERQGTAQVRVRYLRPAPPAGPQRGPGSQTDYAGAIDPPAPAAPPGLRADVQETGPFRPVPPAAYGPEEPPRGEPGRGGIYVQVASFRDPRRADALTRRLGEVGRARVDPVWIRGLEWHRVMLGPLRDAGEAAGARAAVARLGFADARIVSIN